jgi:hypothetical protein
MLISYIHETNHAARVYFVAANLQFMLRVMLFGTQYVFTLRITCAVSSMAVFVVP